MFRFYWPWAFLLLPLPWLVKLWFPTQKGEEAPELYFPSINRLKRAYPKYQPAISSSIFFTVMLSLIWALVVLALMQPENVDRFTEVKNKGYDLMLAVDISASMQAVDFSTNLKTISRLDATKDVVSQFVLGRQGDRVGLITFGQQAYLHVPLTLDTLSVSKMLNDTVSGMAGQGTAIGDAIGLGVRTLRDRPEGSRILILLTDGEDNASRIPPMEAAKLAKEYGIKIYTIGIGKQGLVPYPTRGGYGLVETKMDEDLLKNISAMTGGHYFSAADPNSLKSTYEKINELEKTESNMSVHFIREPLYRIPLVMALGLLFVLTFYLLILYRRPVSGTE